MPFARNDTSNTINTPIYAHTVFCLPRVTMTNLLSYQMVAMPLSPNVYPTTIATDLVIELPHDDVCFIHLRELPLL